MHLEDLHLSPRIQNGITLFTLVADKLNTLSSSGDKSNSLENLLASKTSAKSAASKTSNLKGKWRLECVVIRDGP